jgi:hypothetical protein
MEAKKLYERMKSENDFEPIIATAVRECNVPDSNTALSLLDAFLQWISIYPLMEEGKKLQMLRGVDPIWHAFILNTRAYREFCEKYFGEYLDHDPTDVDEASGKDEYSNYTLYLLRQEFGNGVHPKLLLLEEGATCCSPIGCSKKTTSLELQDKFSLLEN